ncbi:O-antigen ligase family protein [Mesorhizobium xinjiangense]|uniref:O-antigen ligase family protein n=1 Tax=Mesorhizobium xinjiangense TaxID=2678685 RepID=UPI0012ED8D7D|nr:O-antigen ligase [Mesorhizobium xinjiangense]
MRIAKAALIDPERNALYGIPAIAVSVFVFAYSAIFGQVSILLYYALWLPLVLVDYRKVLGNYARYYWILAFGLFACLSIFWSAAPSVTARAAIQFMSHIVCALIAARTMSVRTVTLGTLCGVFVVLIYSLAFGRYHHDPFDGSYSFVGAFTSKNQLGFFASLGVYFALIATFVTRERGAWRAFVPISGILSAYSLIASQSATSIIATVLTLASLVGLAGLLLFRARARLALLLLGSLLALMAGVAAFQIGLLDFVLGAFGKDTTLTGRTYLWAQGMEAGARTPIFGVGYQAYWVHGFAEAERLWEEFYIRSRTGFHFHNTYIAMYVELGLVGVFLFSLALAKVLAGYFGRLLTGIDRSSSFTLFGVTVMLLVRSFFELDMVNPYSIGAFLLYYAAGLIAAPRLLTRASGAQPERTRRPAPGMAVPR